MCERKRLLFGKHMQCTNTRATTTTRNPQTDYIFVWWERETESNWTALVTQYERKRSIRQQTTTTSDEFNHVLVLLLLLLFFTYIPYHQYIDARRFLIGYILECVSLRPDTLRPDTLWPILLLLFCCFFCCFDALNAYACVVHRRLMIRFYSFFCYLCMFGCAP